MGDLFHKDKVPPLLSDLTFFKSLIFIYFLIENFMLTKLVWMSIGQSLMELESFPRASSSKCFPQ